MELKFCHSNSEPQLHSLHNLSYFQGSMMAFVLHIYGMANDYIQQNTMGSDIMIAQQITNIIPKS